MASVVDVLPLAETIAPADQAGVADAVRAACDARQAVYPLGGQTALDYGIVAKREGRGLELKELDRVVDYTPRDMTIVVEAGVRMSDLAATLAAEGQQLPIDVPQSSQATIGGVCATNWSGPRRYGYGTLRDYVIGIHAVDGRGVAFQGGGRVVKNVAGYDFCKLLTGSLGTLGIVTQLALKVKPLPDRSAAMAAECPDLDVAEAVLQRLTHLPAPPVAIDLLVGTAWQAEALAAAPAPPAVTLVVRIEGSEAEVAALCQETETEIRAGGAAAFRQLAPAEADSLWEHQVEFAHRGTTAAGDKAPLVVKIAVPPSAVTTTLALLCQCASPCTIQAHAASGILYAHLAEFTSADLSDKLIGRFRPHAVRHHGSTVVVSTTLAGLTPHMTWGPRTDATRLMEQIKRQFDPHHILNPGRFVF